MSESSHVGLWNRCLEIIRDNVPESTYKTWFVPIVPLKYEDKTLIVQVPSQFFYEFLEDKFVDLLRKTLYKVIGDGTKLMYNVLVDKSSGATVNQESTTRSTAIPQSGLPRVDERKAPGLLRAPAVQDLDPHLNPNYNFETFIEGYSNKLSRSVAEAVAENPAKTDLQSAVPPWSIGSRKDPFGQCHRYPHQRVVSGQKSALCFSTFISGTIYRFRT